jgi:hypothetical protein
MKTDTARKRKPDGIDHTVDLSHAAGRRVRIRELCEIHESITVGEIVEDMTRNVEVTRAMVIGTISELERAGFLMVLDHHKVPRNRRVRIP